MVFGLGYILEYSAGILAVTKPRELYIEGRKTNLYAFGAEAMDASQDLTATLISAEDKTLEIITAGDEKSRFYNQSLIVVSCTMLQLAL